MHPTGKLGAPCAALAVLAASCAQDPMPPNVVVIAVDTLRADHLEPYGYARETSPNIAALADEGIVFQQATSTAPWTNPSMVSVFTGLAPDALGVMPDAIKIPDKLETLGETFKRAGYATHGVVSHLYLASKYGFDQGFDSWDEDDAQGHTHISSPSVSDKAIAIVQGHERTRPLLLFLHYFDPHYDYLEHEGHRFSGEYSGELESVSDNFSALRKQAQAGAFGPADVQHLNDLYDSEIAFTDHHIGRVLAELRRQGLYENTLIVFTADHGEALGERPDMDIGHGRSVFQNVVHVPLIFKLPGTAEPRSISSPASTQHVLATLLGYLRLPDERGIAEASLLALDGSEVLFASSFDYFELVAARQGRWKLIRNNRTGETRLFDLESDPDELDDRAADAPEVVASLESQLATWSESNDSLRELLATDTPELSEAELERLRLLGYTDDRPED